MSKIADQEDGVYQAKDESFSANGEKVFNLLPEHVQDILSDKAVDIKRKYECLLQKVPTIQSFPRSLDAMLMNILPSPQLSTILENIPTVNMSVQTHKQTGGEQSLNAHAASCGLIFRKFRIYSYSCDT